MKWRGCSCLGVLLAGSLLSPLSGLRAQDGRDAMLAALDQRSAHLTDVAMEIWDLAELGYLEDTERGAVAGRVG